jgi:hypothetical protein
MVRAEASMRDVPAVLGLALLLALSGCGSGGTGGGGLVDDDAELTQDDLDAAGVPGLPGAAPTSVFATTDTVGCRETITVGPFEAVDSRGLTPVADGFVGAGIVPGTPNRVVAWLMYELPASAGARTREITIGYRESDFHFAVAVSNYGAGRWEIGQRLTVPAGAGNDLVRLSTGERYNRGDGRCFVLLLFLNPGPQPNGLSVKLQDVLVSSVLEACREEGFAAGEEGSLEWEDDHLSVVAGNAIGTMTFRGGYLDDTDLLDGLTVLFAQPFQAEVVPWLWFLGVATGDVNGDGIDYLFYDPQELNGHRHPYELTYDDGAGGGGVVGAAPLLTPPGGTEPDAIIGILIGHLRQPLPGATVTLWDHDFEMPVRSAVTDARGRFVLEDLRSLDIGTSYSLRVGPGTTAIESLSLNFFADSGGGFVVNGAP